MHTESQESKIERVAKYHFSILETLSSWMGALWNKVAVLLGYKRKPSPVIKVFSSEYVQAVIDKQVELQQRNRDLNTFPKKSFDEHTREGDFLRPSIKVEESNFACARIGNKHIPFFFRHSLGFEIFGMTEAVRGKKAANFMARGLPNKLSNALQKSDLSDITRKKVEQIVTKVFQELEKEFVEKFSKSSYFRLALTVNLLLQRGRLFTINIGDTRTIVQQPSKDIKQLTADASQEPHMKMLLAQRRANHTVLEALKMLVVRQDKKRTDEGRRVIALKDHVCRVFKNRIKEKSFCDRREAGTALKEAKSMLTNERKAVCSESSVSEFYRQLEPLEKVCSYGGSLEYSIGITETRVAPGSTILSGAGIFKIVSSSLLFSLMDLLKRQNPSISQGKLAEMLMQAIVAKVFDRFEPEGIADDEIASEDSEEESIISDMAFTFAVVP